jgi:hypothetical protein
VIRALLGYRFLYPMIAPTGLCILTLAVWLIVRGFDDRRANSEALTTEEV